MKSKKNVDSIEEMKHFVAHDLKKIQTQQKLLALHISACEVSFIISVSIHIKININFIFNLIIEIVCDEKTNRFIRGTSRLGKCMLSFYVEKNYWPNLELKIVLINLTGCDDWQPNERLLDFFRRFYGTVI